MLNWSAMITSDWHLSNNLPYAKQGENDLISDRLKDLQNVIDWIVTSALEHKVPLIILGDIFDHRQPDAPTLKAFAQTVKAAVESGLELYVLPGNHDAYDTRGCHYLVEAFGIFGVNNFRIMETGIAEEIGDVMFCPVPYQSKKATLESIESYKKLTCHSPKVLLLHDTVKGAFFASGLQASDGIPKSALKGFDHVLCGHIHEYQKLSPVKGAYVGSPFQTNFNEINHTPGISLLASTSGRIQCHRVEIPSKLSKNFYEIRMNGDGEITSKGDESARYARVIFEGSTGMLSAHKDELSRIKHRLAQKSRSVMFIHRDAAYAGKGRLGINILADGMPSMEEVVKRYVDDVALVENKTKLVDIGVEILNGAK